MSGVRGMASIAGSVHRLNIVRFQEAAIREATRVAKRDGLVSPWIVDVVVHNDDGPSYLASVSGGVLVTWDERELEEPAAEPEELRRLEFERMTLHVGFTHQELEDGLASGDWVLLRDELDPERGRIKSAAMVKVGTVIIVDWCDENDDGGWAWIETSQVPIAWLPRLMRLAGGGAGTSESN